jgi:uncharacterized protein with HEPN domain
LKSDKVYLLNILDAIKRIDKYLKGISIAKFLKDTEKQDAVIRNIEIIGEAANNLSKDFQHKHKEIPWRNIVDMRNKLIHDYDSVDYQIVWDVYSSKLPALKKQISALVKTKN